MTTNRLKHIEPSSTALTGSDTTKARALGSLSADQSALEWGNLGTLHFSVTAFVS